MQNSPAFSLVEVLVALMIFSTGLLGLASTAAWSAQAIRAGRQLTETAVLAERELAAFQSGGCGWSGEGERVHGAFGLEWAIREPSSGHQFVTLVVTSRYRRGERADTFSATVRC